MGAPLRVASIPAGHPFPRHLLPLGDRQRARHPRVHLPDPVLAGRPPGQWWPPAMLDRRWIEDHAGSVDVFHVHFGMESLAPGELADALAALRAGGVPLVYTAHDLTNPQLTDQAGHLADLDLMMAAADRVLTLTPGAATQIRERWGRVATVIPHPHVLPLDQALLPGRIGRDEPLRVGVHLRDLRPNIDGVGTVSTLLAAADRLAAEDGPASAHVQLNDRVRDDPAAAEVSALVLASPRSTLVRGERLDDDALVRSLLDLDVSVLPYRSGTHSGWVELCWDLGVPVVAPAGVGFAHQQHDLTRYRPGDPDDLARAVRQAVGDLEAARSTRSRIQVVRRRERRRQRRRVSTAHDAVYRSLLGPASSPRP